MDRGCPQHDGSAAGPDDVALGDPDRAIGPVLSMYTDMTRRGRKAWEGRGKRTRGRIFLAVIGGTGGMILAGTLGGYVSRKLGVPIGEDARTVAGALLGAFLPQLLFTRPPALTTFVGEQGVARWLQGRGGARQEVLRFADAAALLTFATRMHVEHAYVGTRFSYTWRDGGGRALFTIEGVFHEGDGERAAVVEASSPIHFARAAAASWIAFRLPGVEEALARGKAVRFKSADEAWLEVTQDRLVVHAKGKTRELPYEDVHGAEVDGGVLVIQVKAAKRGLLGSEVEEHRLPSGHTEDVELFLHLLEERMGREVLLDRQEEPRLR